MTAAASTSPSSRSDKFVPGSLAHIDFDDLQPVSVTFSYRKKQYVLKEASEDAAAKYRNAQLRATKMSDGKVTGVDGMADCAALLLSMCVFEQVSFKDKGGVDQISEKAVLPGEIRAWQTKVVRPLFEKAKEISELGEEETEEALVKRIEDAERKLDVIRKRNAPLPTNGQLQATTGSSSNEPSFEHLENPAKNEPSATSITSA